MYKRIVIAVDGSQTSVLAVREAAKIANKDTQLLLVTVADSVNMAYLAPYDIEAVRASMRDKAKSVLDRAKDVLADFGLNAETRLLDLNIKNENSIPEAILNEARAWVADLIVLGTHGRRGMRRFFLGSVAEQIARISSLPVLLVRSPDVSLLISLNPAEIYADWPEDEVI